MTFDFKTRLTRNFIHPGDSIYLYLPNQVENWVKRKKRIETPRESNYENK
jgi:hypothetical protein